MNNMILRLITALTLFASFGKIQADKACDCIVDHAKIKSEENDKLFIDAHNFDEANNGSVKLNFQSGKFKGLKLNRAWSVDTKENIESGEFFFDLFSSLEDPIYFNSNAVDLPQYFPSLNWLLNESPPGSQIDVPNCAINHTITNQEYRLTTWNVIDESHNPEESWSGKTPENQCVVDYLFTEARKKIDYEINCSDLSKKVSLILVESTRPINGESVTDKQVLVAEISAEYVCSCTGDCDGFQMETQNDFSSLTPSDRVSVRTRHAPSASSSPNEQQNVHPNDNASPTITSTLQTEELNNAKSYIPNIYPTKTVIPDLPPSESNFPTIQIFSSSNSAIPDLPPSESNFPAIQTFPPSNSAIPSLPPSESNFPTIQTFPPSKSAIPSLPPLESNFPTIQTFPPSNSAIPILPPSESNFPTIQTFPPSNSAIPSLPPSESNFPTIQTFPPSNSVLPSVTPVSPQIKNSEKYSGGSSKKKTSIKIEKTVKFGPRGGNACNPGAKLVEGSENTIITYSFVVTNNGETCLDNVLLVDENLEYTIRLPGIFHIGEQHRRCFQTVIENEQINAVAHVYGNPVDCLVGNNLLGYDDVESSDSCTVKMVSEGDASDKGQCDTSQEVTELHNGRYIITKTETCKQCDCPNAPN